MTPRRLDRRQRGDWAAAPARIAHLGLGGFFRAHIEAGALARLVAAGRIGEYEATAIAGRLVGDQPRRVLEL